MSQPVVVIAPATLPNFHEKGYLLANADVAAAGANARRHFESFGVREGRQTITREFLDGRGERDRRKYERFSPLLDAGSGVNGTFKSVDRHDAFPVFFGEKPYVISSYDAESANGGLGEFVQEIEAHPERNYLDIGCGFRSQIYENCLYLEVYPSLTADIIMEPACRYPIKSASLDGICCLAVLEHVEKPWVVVDEIRRMLKPGGLAFIDWPFLQPVHGYPSHFYNATRFGLAEMFKDGFEQITLDTFANQTPDHTLNWILREWSTSLTSKAVRGEMLAMTVGDLISQPPGSPLWRRILDATPEKTKMTLACGNTLIARRLDDDPSAPAPEIESSRPAKTGWGWRPGRRRP